ncbi:hypothetical protein JCM30237_01700 [Halolamina litorea]|uniref:Uncharacterized protein n=1 Tax=Halolamina litorea TaxID=1515593 RepID=A0ABD6BS36_9EURY|nr:hypothetical protein [Halolamina litorea]
MPPRDEVDRLLFGRDPVLSTRLLRVAGGLFVLALLAYLPVRYMGTVSLTGPVVTAGLAVAMFGVAAAAAYVNDGLFVSVALSSGVGVGFYAPAIAFELQDPGDAALWVLAAGPFSSLAVGVVGFAAGAGLARLRSSRRRAGADRR